MTFYQTRSNAIILYNVLPPCCIEKVVLWKTGEELYDQVYKSPRSPPKITLKTAWTKRRVDTSNLEARESSADSSEHRETLSQKSVNDGSVNQHRETGSLSDNCPEIDFRVRGLPYSTVEQQDTTRKNIVKNLIHQIETHPHREALKADLQQHDSKYEKRGILRDVRSLSQDPVPSMSGVLHERGRVLQMRILPGTDQYKTTNKQGSI